MGVLSRLAERRIGRSDYTPVITFDGVLLFNRFRLLWPDEWHGQNRLPWWRPFNAFLHNWKHGEADAFHDHPRWSITICLSGKIIERTPWGDRLLKPGSVVIRSRKFIHAFALPEDAGDVWTLFIVGRRKHLQNTYAVKHRTAKECGLASSNDNRPAIRDEFCTGDVDQFHSTTSNDRGQ